MRQKKLDEDQAKLGELQKTSRMLKEEVTEEDVADAPVSITRSDNPFLRIMSTSSDSRFPEPTIKNLAAGHSIAIVGMA